MKSARSYAAVSVMKGILMVPSGIISCDLRNEINQIILQNKVVLWKHPKIAQNMRNAKTSLAYCGPPRWFSTIIGMFTARMEVCPTYNATKHYR